MYTWLTVEWERESCLHQCTQGERPQATRSAHSLEGAGEEEVQLCGVTLGYVYRSKQSWLDVSTFVPQFRDDFIKICREIDDEDEGGGDDGEEFEDGEQLPPESDSDESEDEC